MKIEEIKELLEAVSNSALTEFEYEEGAVRLSLKKTAQALAAAPLPVSCETPPISFAAKEPLQEEKKEQTIEGKVVKSPLVGTFYTAPAEDAPPFVSVGDSVKEGQVLAIVEAMKLMNEIESDYTGTVVQVLVGNGETVEYGQPLFVIK